MPRSRISSSFRNLREHLLQLEAEDKKAHYNQALQKAQYIAAMLKASHEVNQVYLYGSLAWGGFGNQSDIDLFLAGFEGDYWKAYAEAAKIAAPIEVSLACEEDCFDSLRDKVLTMGVLL